MSKESPPELGEVARAPAPASVSGTDTAGPAPEPETPGEAPQSPSKIGGILGRFGKK